MEGYILGREVPNIGEWTQFSSARIANLQKNKIEIPKPTVSAHTVPKSQWIVSMPNTSGKFFVSRHYFSSPIIIFRLPYILWK